MLTLQNLDVYNLSIELAQLGWNEYSKMDWRIKKIIGDQYITSIDSIGANIAEGYGRFHYLDKIKFFYNARGSYYEATHWLKLLQNRKIIDDSIISKQRTIADQLIIKLNGLISSTYKMKISTNY